MLILPDKLTRYVGAAVLDKDKNTVGQLTYCVPSNMKKMVHGANAYVSWIPYNPEYILDAFPGNPQTEEINNTPQRFELLARLSRYKNPSWLVSNDGLISEMDDYTFYDAVLLGLQDKKFNCTFNWVYDTGKMRLVVTDSDTYQAALNENKTRSSKIIKQKDLIFGGIYEDLPGRQMMYLGNLMVNQIKQTGTWPNYVTQTVQETRTIYVYAGNRIDNKSYSSIKDISFGYDLSDFAARRLITVLNITLDDVKKELKKLNNNLDII